MRTTRIAIIGAGPAGCAAAVQCLRLGVRPLVLDRSGLAGGLITNAYCVENYPGIEPMRGSEVGERMRAHLARFSVEVVQAHVEAIRHYPLAFVLDTDLGPIQAHAVIVATGTEPRPWKITIPGEVAGRVHTEVRHLLPLAPRDAVIVGGGDAACDFALSLAREGVRARVLVRGSRLVACARLVEQVERESAIRVLYRAPVRSLGVGLHGSIEVASADARLSTDAVLLAVGRRRTVPELVTKICTRLTASEGLWIVGDARAGSLGQVGVAVGDGLAAAARACQFVRAEQQEEAYDSHYSTQ